MSLTPGEYYAKHYPYEQLVKLLTRNGDDLANCEFALDGKTASGDKLYKRYVSVRNAAELRAAVSRFPGIRAFHFRRILQPRIEQGGGQERRERAFAPRAVVRR